MRGDFAYRAIRADGSIESGSVEAGTDADVRTALAARGLLPLEVRVRAGYDAGRARIGAADLALGLRILADLLDSGLPMSRALHTFEELAPKGWRPALPYLRQTMKEGQSFAAALAGAPVEVPGLVIGIAQAGEAGSGIGPAIRRAADLTEHTAEMQAAVRSALAYPALVAVAGTGAVAILMAVVLPRFAHILGDLGQSLPVSTRMVLGVAGVARAGAVPAALGIVVAIGAWRAWTSTDAGRRAWHGWLLATPLLGTVRQLSAAARMSHAFSALLESGVSLNTALAHAARATGDAEITHRVLLARASIADGEPLSRALERSGAATPTVIRLARAGEETGQLASMLMHAAKLEQGRADRIVRGAVRMLEPILLLLFAAVVALVAAALLQAIYSVRPTV